MQVCVLTSKANPVPKVVEMLLMHVELNGLYTEGIYRKSGSTCRARELHQILETSKKFFAHQLKTVEKHDLQHVILFEFCAVIHSLKIIVGVKVMEIFFAIKIPLFLFRLKCY